MLLLAGFGALACGTWRQSRILFGRTASARIRYGALALGYALIVAALLVALAGDDPARGAVAWFGAMTVAALVVVALCWVRDRRTGWR